MTVPEQIHRVKLASRAIAASSNEERNDLLFRVADGLASDWPLIEKANGEDILRAEESGEKEALISRLRFSRGKRDDVIRSLRDVAALSDPKGRVLEKRELDEGFILSRVSVPLGVIAMVFEARPDALVQIVSLAIKSGNAIILKGGSEARRTNEALAASIEKSLSATSIGASWFLLLTSREDVSLMLTAEKDIDLVIPRGSNSFVRYVMDHTHIPVLGHASGICHLYIEKSADLEKAVPIAIDSKTQYPAACNSVETILVDAAIAPSFVPTLVSALQKRGVVVHGDEDVCALVPSCVPPREGDWDTEYLRAECNIRVVKDEREAIEHVNEHGSHHTDAILSEDPLAAAIWQRDVDSADVFVNCSTRFADGYRYGLGAEVGISTSKIHARGPVGLSGLMSSKWLLSGHGELVSSYMGPTGKAFTHKELS